MNLEEFRLRHGIFGMTKSDMKSSKKEELSALGYLDRAIKTTTVHRIGLIYQIESRFLKCTLGALFILSAGYCTYQIVNTIITFSEFDVLTTTSYIYEIPAEFPGNKLI